VDQYISFVSQNLILVGALGVILAMLVFNLFGARLRGYKTVHPAEAVTMINHDDALVLDVRENSEYQSGHIISSTHIPLSSLSGRLGELEKYKNKPVIVGCRSGQRSGQACAQLKKQGFDNVFNLTGGVTAWQSANLPLTRK